MKLFYILAVFLISTNLSTAQMGTWTVKLNNKKIVSTSKEDEKANCKKLKRSDWNKNGKLQIIFKEDEPDTWSRSFLFYDENDNELFREDSTTNAIIPLEKLRTIYANKKSVIIYTVIAPLDPSIAIRIRRVHLYTFQLP